MGDGERRQGRRAFLTASASAIVCGAAWGWTAQPFGATGADVRDDVWREARDIVRGGRIGRLVWGQAETGVEAPIEKVAERLVYAADVQTVRAASFVGGDAGPGAGGLATLDCEAGVTLVVVAQRDHVGPLRLTLRGVDGVLRCDGDRLSVRQYREGPATRTAWPG